MNLPDTAQKILSAFSAQLEAQAVDLPERQYVSPGNIAVWDGEQLVVNLQDVLQGQPGAPYAGTYGPGSENLSAQFSVAIVRKIPVVSSGRGPKIPSAKKISEAGFEAMEDAEALVKAAVAIHSTNAITGLGQGFSIDPCSTLGPEGGLAATRLLLTISL